MTSVEEADEAPPQANTPPPLTTEIFSADPSAHLYEGRLYVYCSHDSPQVTEGLDGLEHEVPQFYMTDYHVLSLDASGSGPAVVHDVALKLADVPWAGGKLWAPDAAYANGTYHLYFPAMDKEGVFRIGVASAQKPHGPFVAQPKPMVGSYSIDPACFRDDDGAHYLFFGGIWGGQLQRWESGTFDASPGRTTDAEQPDAPAIAPRFARLADDMLEFAYPPKPVVIVDEAGAPIPSSDHERRYFEGPWVHRRKGLYYLSWSTGDTHRIVHATAPSIDGPFVYRGVVSHAVHGWTHHHSIVNVGEVEGEEKWLFFFHDTHRSGQTHLRDVKVVPLQHRADGSIEPLSHHYAEPSFDGPVKSTAES